MFHRIGGVSPDTFHSVKYDAPEEVVGDRKCFHWALAHSPAHNVNKHSPDVQYVWFGWHWGRGRFLMIWIVDEVLINTARHSPHISDIQAPGFPLDCCQAAVRVCMVILVRSRNRISGL